MKTSARILYAAIGILSIVLSASLNAQQLPISDFVMYSGAGGQGTSTPPSPGYGVFIGSTSSLTGGSIGSAKLVQTSCAVSISGNINSGGKVVLANGNTIGGKITAANAYNNSGTIFQAGSSSVLNGNIDVNGNIVVSGGSVNAKVTHPAGTTYTGPTPTGGNVT